jgi:hypothetical protein
VFRVRQQEYCGNINHFYEPALKIYKEHRKLKVECYTGRVFDEWEPM